MVIYCTVVTRQKIGFFQWHFPFSTQEENGITIVKIKDSTFPGTRYFFKEISTFLLTRLMTKQTFFFLSEKKLLLFAELGSNRFRYSLLVAVTC